MADPTSLEAPKPAAPQRLKPTALWVFALLAMMSVFVASYFVMKRPARPVASAAALSEAGAPPAPSFLQRPPAAPAVAQPRVPFSESDPLAEQEQAALGGPAGGALPLSGAPPPPYPSAGRGPYPLAPGAAPYPPSPIAPSVPETRRRDAGDEAFERALRSPIQGATSHPGATEVLPARAAGGPPSAAVQLPSYPDLAGGADAAAVSPPSPPRAEDPHAAFLASVRTPRPSELPVFVEPPTTPYRLDAGTVLPALLMTGVNSDLPGDLSAQVTRDVFDSATESLVLIPRGSRLLGTYSNQVALGQDRLLVAWDRLIFPDGTTLRFPGLPGVSPSGEAGLQADANNHLGRVFGSALLLSLVGAGAQLSQPQESASFGAAASPRQVAAAALGQEFSSVALEILRRRLNVAPTLRLPAGTRFEVYLRGNISFPGPASR
jgi:type IV secretory pathway VirB10-like protein